jgi:hypothetical protein
VSTRLEGDRTCLAKKDAKFTGTVVVEVKKAGAEEKAEARKAGAGAARKTEEAR